MTQNQAISVDSSKPDLGNALAAATLEFVAPRFMDGYLAAAMCLHGRGIRNFVLKASVGERSFARELHARMAAYFPDVTCLLETDAAAAAAKNHSVPVNCAAVFFLERDAAVLSAALMDYVNFPISIVAPITEHYFRRRAVYMITVPKSGTHMLFELLGAFNLINGGQGQGPLSPQHYYSVSAVHSHTKAHKFFDSLDDLPRGGADHPLFMTPTLFMYRNPLDAVVSEAYYLQDATKSARAHHFSLMSLDERLIRLIKGDFTIGSLRDRMAQFITWLHLPNVIPVSFEELVGPQGNGSREEQLKTIWSLQLKLHVPGSPAFYAASVFRRESATFRQGTINSHLEHFSEACYVAVRELDQDFMREFGYDLHDRFTAGYVPRFVDSFRRRPLVLKCSEPTAGKKETASAPEEGLPDAVYAYRGYLAASLARVHCALPQSAAYPVDPRLTTGGPHFHLASTWDELLAMLDAEPLGESDSHPRIVLAMRSHDLFQLDPSQPVLAAEDVCGFNIVAFNGQFYCIDHGRGTVDVQWDDTDGVFVARTVDEARAYCQMQAQRAAAVSEERNEPLPRLVEEGRNGFNIVEFRGKYFALAQSLGPTDVARIDEAWLAGKSPQEALANQLLDDLVRQIDSLCLWVAESETLSSTGPLDFAGRAQAAPVEIIAAATKGEVGLHINRLSFRDFLRKARSWLKRPISLVGR